MGMQYVVVQAWVPDWSGGGNYPDQGLPPSGVGIWPGPGVPTHPIAPGGPPPTVWPGPGRPDQGLPVPPQVWPGPGRTDQGLPVPPEIWPGPGRPDQGLPGQPPGFWGGSPVPTPTPPIYLPSPPGIWGGAPSYPDQGLPPSCVGIWPGPGRPDQGLPPSGVGIWPSPGRPEHPIVIPPESEMPEHPELPDLNAGNWIYVRDQGGVYTPAFVPWPLAVTHPDYNPAYPEQGTPGEWVVIAYSGVAAWAWVPSSEGGGESGRRATKKSSAASSSSSS
jgi:hypothetical protein